MSLFARVCCAVGLHAWYYVLRETPAHRLERTGMRICTSCPAKQQRTKSGQWQ